MGQKENQDEVEQENVDKAVEIVETSGQVEGALKDGSPGEDNPDAVVDDVSDEPGAHGKVEGEECHWVEQAIHGGKDPHLLNEPVYPTVFKTVDDQLPF